MAYVVQLWKGDHLHFSPKQETDKGKMDGFKYKKKNICIMKLVQRGRGRKLNKGPGNQCILNSQLFGKRQNFIIHH